ncbi:helix-turn-helix domain-containing protein [Pseudarthrobacter sp. Y6]|uniref:helix-turn-helix domain-containing protein n=1 Tax=Pseudarthrobacter sp. Y6 TaxID=3418422 RepID=UPI003CEF01FD
MSQTTMGEEPADRAPAFGPKIRHARKQLGLTLTELAAQCNISPSFLSQIERDLTRPSVATLHRLAVALGLPMSEMLAAPRTGSAADSAVLPFPTPKQHVSVRSHFGANHESSQYAKVVRADKRPVILYPGSQIRNEMLSPDLNHALQMMWVVIPPGEGTGDEGLVHEGEECGVVIQGRVGIWVGPANAEEYYELGPGDAIYQDSTIPHRSRNIGAETVLIVTAMTPPSL